MYSTITQFNKLLTGSIILYYAEQMPLICVTAWWC